MALRIVLGSCGERPAIHNIHATVKDAAFSLDLFAREPQRRPLSTFGGTQPAFFMQDVVARHRHDALPLRELNLEHHRGVIAEIRRGEGEQS